MEYGQFFMEWYLEMFFVYGECILVLVIGIFRGIGVVILGKVVGIYWYYGIRSYVVELIVGYYNI